MRKLLLPAFCLLCLAGCNDNAAIADFESVENSSAAASRYSNLDFIRQRIGMNAQTRGSDQASIEPYIYEGDTVMYIVNYEDGWELLSNDTSVPMVVAHADTGEFIKDSLPQSMSVYFDNVAKNLFDRNTAGIANSDLNGEWCMFASSGVPPVPVFPEDTIIINTQDTLFSDFITTVSYETIIGTGGWVPIDTISYTTTNLLEAAIQIDTDWKAGWPWNMFAPMNSKGHCDNNHAAVVIGQYLAYLRNKFGAAFQVADSLSYDSSIGEYVPARYGSSILDNVANTADDSSVAVQNAAMVIRGITYDMNTIYHNGYPITDLTKTRTYLNSLGFTNVGKVLNFNNIYNKLNLEIPQIIPIVNNSASNNDFYCLAMAIAIRKNHVRSCIKYGWLGLDSNGNSTIGYDNGGYYYRYQCVHSTDYEADEMRVRWVEGSRYDNSWITIDGGIQQNVNSNDYQSSAIWDLSLSTYF